MEENQNQDQKQETDSSTNNNTSDNSQTPVGQEENNQQTQPNAVSEEPKEAPSVDSLMQSDPSGEQASVQTQETQKTIKIGEQEVKEEEKPKKKGGLLFVVGFVFLFLLVLGGSIFFFYVLNPDDGSQPEPVTEGQIPQVSPQAKSPEDGAGFDSQSGTSSALTKSDELEDIEKDINSTTVDEVENDLDEINQDINAL